MSRSRMALASLMFLVLSTTLLVATAQGYLQIFVDLDESDWMPSEWVSPGGGGCPVPTRDYTAWRCCDTMGMPRQCQLVWRDADDRDTDDILYARLYLNSTGLYFFAYAHTLIRRDSILWLNTSGYKLRINITGSTNMPVCELHCSGRKIERSSGETKVNSTKPGYRLWREIEAFVRFEDVFKDTGCSPIKDDTYDISIRFTHGTFIGDRMTVVSSVGPHVVTLVVANYYIVDAYYVMSGTKTPIPVPEPGIFVVASVITSTIVLGVVFFTRRSSV